MRCVNGWRSPAQSSSDDANKVGTRDATTTARLYVPRSMRYYWRMPHTVGDVRHAAWSVSALRLGSGGSLYDRH
jgi:hypothetical protein